jgi:hypothetical protein
VPRARANTTTRNDSSENPRFIGTSAARANFIARVRRGKIFECTFFRKSHRTCAAVAGRGTYTQN